MARLHLSTTLVNLGEYEAALPYLKEIADTVPERPESWYPIGNCYFELDQLPLAVENFHRSLDLDPFNPDAHLGLGKCFLRQRDYERAILHLEAALRARMPRRFVVLLLARAHFRAGDLEQACKYALEATELTPDSADAWCMYGAICKDLGKLDESERAHLIALKIDPNCFEAAYNLAWIYIAKGQVSCARMWAQKVWQIAPDRVEARDLLERCQASQTGE